MRFIENYNGGYDKRFVKDSFKTVKRTKKSDTVEDDLVFDMDELRGK